jgi:hypothetical protein
MNWPTNLIESERTRVRLSESVVQSINGSEYVDLTTDGTVDPQKIYCAILGMTGESAQAVHAELGSMYAGLAPLECTSHQPPPTSVSITAVTDNEKCLGTVGAVIEAYRIDDQIQLVGAFLGRSRQITFKLKVVDFKPSEVREALQQWQLALTLLWAFTDLPNQHILEWAGVGEMTSWREAGYQANVSDRRQRDLCQVRGLIGPADIQDRSLAERRTHAIAAWIVLARLFCGW